MWRSPHHNAIHATYIVKS